MSLESPSDSAVTTLYRAALGPVNTERYVQAFARLDAMGRTLTSWHWAACFFTLGWMVYRRLWGAALVYVAAAEGVALLVFGLGRPLLQWPQAVEWGVVGAFAVLGSVVPGLYAHAILHADIRKRVTKALAASANIPEACDLLAKQAVSRKRLTWVAAGHAIIATAAALAYWVFPQGTEPPAAQPTQGHAASWNTPSPTLAAASRAIPRQPDSTPPSVQAAAVAAPAAEDAPAAATLQETAPQPTANPSDPTLANKPRDTAKDKDKDKAKSVSNATEKTAEKAAEQARPPKPAEKAKETPAAKNPTQPPAASKNTPAAKASEPSRSKPAAPAKSTAATPQPQGQATPASETNADTASAVGTSPGFYINVGLFADESNARKAQSRLLNEGLPAFRQTLDSAKGARTRVRVGPFASRAQAESAASAIRALELDAVIFRK